MVNRRDLFTAGGIGAASGLVTLAATRPVEAAATNQLPAVQSAGPFTVGGADRILIGLLLPAVQKVRTPFRFALVAGDGSVLVARELLPAVQRAQSPFMSSFFDVFAGDGSVRVVDHSTQEAIYDGPAPGGQIIAILIGLVDGTGRTRGAIGGSVQFFDADRLSPRMILPYIEQDNL